MVDPFEALSVVLACAARSVARDDFLSNDLDHSVVLEGEHSKWTMALLVLILVAVVAESRQPHPRRPCDVLEADDFSASPTPEK